MVSLREHFNSLSLSPDASATEKRRRGYAFEEFLEALLAGEKLDPRIRLRPTGEEVDGSFVLDQRIYLLEAKWHARPLPASTIYAFKGKVDGKLLGTIGVFISMSGYSEEAIDALTIGKGLNVLLMDGNDIEASINHGFAHILRVKLRAAAEEGAVFYPFTSTISTISDDKVTEESAVPTDESELGGRENQIVVLCEGHSDTTILNRLVQRILTRESLSSNLRLIAAQGKQGIPRIANAIYPLLPDSTPLIIVTDSDGNVEETERNIKEQVTVPYQLFIIDPELEAWFAPGVANPKLELNEKARVAKQPIAEYIDKKIEDLDMNEMMKNVPDFNIFYNSIIEAAARNRKK